MAATRRWYSWSAGVLRGRGQGQTLATALRGASELHRGRDDSSTEPGPARLRAYARMHGPPASERSSRRDLPRHHPRGCRRARLPQRRRPPDLPGPPRRRDRPLPLAAARVLSDGDALPPGRRDHVRAALPRDEAPERRLCPGLQRPTSPRRPPVGRPVHSPRDRRRRLPPSRLRLRDPEPRQGRPLRRPARLAVERLPLRPRRGGGSGRPGRGARTRAGRRA